MSFVSKTELKKQLHSLGIEVQGEYVRKKDIEKLVAADIKVQVKDLKVGDILVVKPALANFPALKNEPDISTVKLQAIEDEGSNEKILTIGWKSKKYKCWMSIKIVLELEDYMTLK